MKISTGFSGLAEEQVGNINRFWTDLSHSNLTSFNPGELVPITKPIEIFPNDHVEIGVRSFIRLAPMIAPMMTNIKFHWRAYFIPNRITFDAGYGTAGWEDFVTGGKTGADASVFPTVTLSSALTSGTLGHYLGLPLVATGMVVSALPFRAYSMIWNEYYASEDLDTMLTVSTAAGSDTTTNTSLKKVRWQGSYFTRALPNPQKGSTGVSLPLGTSARIRGLYIPQATAYTGTTDMYELNGVSTAYTTNDVSNGSYVHVAGSANNVYVDLQNATASTVNQIREAVAKQVVLELLAMGGSRYRKYCKYLFGTKSQDRLDIPEIIGAGTENIVISEVLSTNGASGGNIGQMAGHGVSSSYNKTFRTDFDEHGLILILGFVMPEEIYQEGIPKMFSRTSRWDFPLPQLSKIGMQAIYNRELYAVHATPTGVFGYAPRYAELYSIPNGVSGDFASHATNTLEQWHLARDFGSDPSLNATFIEADPDTARVFASTTYDLIWAKFQFDIKALRPFENTDTPYRLI